MSRPADSYMDALGARPELDAADERALVARAQAGDGPAESLRDIGARLGLSAERVRQLEQRALSKLAAAAEE